jgi:ATP-binding cassette subfamily B protein
MCLVFLLNRIVSALNGINNDVLGQRLVDYISDIMQRQSARLDMSYYDTPSYHDTFHRAQQEATFRPLQVLSNLMSLGGSLLSIAGVVAMLVAASWWVIVVMLVAVVPGFVVRLYKARRIYRFRRENTQLYRRTSYYGSLLTARGAAAELRTYRLTSLFRARFVEARQRLVVTLLSISRRLGMLDVLCAIVEAAAMFGVVWMLISQASVGAITIGSFVMLFEAFRRGQGYLSSLVGAIAGLYDNRLFIGNLFEFLELEPSILSPADPLPMPEEITEVEFRDVTFRYPGMDRNVLEHYSLTARRGEVTRIDGRNGYGKSTLIKLLLRLYDPDSGTVLINGVDIRRYDLVALRSRFGVLFQEFVRYCCTAEENVAFGDVDGHPDVGRALRQSGADSVVSRLPQGIATLLSRLFDGGSELSMGQWQRMALARALASDAPVLLLDEPTAWLDHEGRQQVAQLLNVYKKDHLILLITHSQEL